MRVRSSPSKTTRPPTMRAARGRRPTIDRHVVVLPLPDSPTSPRVSPSWSEKLTRSTALTTRVPPKLKKCVWRSDTSRIGITGGLFGDRSGAEVPGEKSLYLLLGVDGRPGMALEPV